MPATVVHVEAPRAAVPYTAADAALFSQPSPLLLQMQLAYLQQRQAQANASAAASAEVVENTAQFRWTDADAANLVQIRARPGNVKFAREADDAAGAPESNAARHANWLHVISELRTFGCYTSIQQAKNKWRSLAVKYRVTARVLEDPATPPDKKSRLRKWPLLAPLAKVFGARGHAAASQEELVELGARESDLPQLPLAGSDAAAAGGEPVAVAAAAASGGNQPGNKAAEADLSAASASQEDIAAEALQPSADSPSSGAGAAAVAYPSHGPAPEGRRARKKRKEAEQAGRDQQFLHTLASIMETQTHAILTAQREHTDKVCNTLLEALRQRDSDRA